MTDAVEIPTIPVIPAPLRWLGQPAHWQQPEPDALVVRAGGQTDLFADPGGDARFTNAAALVSRVNGDFMLSARVRADLAATYDAAALLLYRDEHTWAKLCLELSPQGRPMIVSVVTRGVSDDCNSWPVDDPASEGVQLRISRLGPAFAFHTRTGGDPWQLVRYFALPAEADGADESDEPEVGLLAQSPVGEGCAVQFTDIWFAAERLTDLRGGS